MSDKKPIYTNSIYQKEDETVAVITVHIEEQEPKNERNVSIRQTIFGTIGKVGDKDITIPLKRPILSTDTVNLTCEDLVQIIESLHGKLIGRFSGVPLTYNHAREQLYAELRESFGQIQEIGKSTESAVNAIQELFMERDNQEKAASIVQMMASVVASELMERFYQQ